ncbi:PE family protein [Mycobacterium sp. ST-F2]|uniref:PE domain-containing protein n=1 Tax=Mycobacterium sp. ST-F2 TaxID=1490484 RepID=UPI00093BF259|nr:PE domain-containing protein [Mycobacterium sp. ST-F2]OKH85603.1 PE family protein [Mycobacterium sp. ST-F2]
MASTNDFAMAPAEVADATKQLDELANRVEKVMQTEAPNLTVTASGRDEVSQRVAATLNQVHDAFGKSAEQGFTEIREVSATLRDHTDNVVAADQDFAV